MNMLKFGYRIVLDGLPDISEFHFFLGSGGQANQAQFSLNVVFVFQKSWNIGKTSLDAKHVGAHLMDQLIKKCVI